MPEEAPLLEVSGVDQSAFENWYASLPQQAGLVRIFDRKSCLSVHGEVAYALAKHLYRSTAQVSRSGVADNGLPGVTLSWALLPSTLRYLLIDPGEHSVEFYEGAGTNWSCTKRGSPSLLSDFEAELTRSGDLGEVPLLAALSLGQTEGLRTVGLAYVDPGARVLRTVEFTDDDHFNHLESALVQLGVRECAVIKDTASEAGQPGAQSLDLHRAMDVLARTGAAPAPRPRASFSARNLDQDLQRLLLPGTLEQHRHVLEGHHASAALAGVLAFGELLADGSGHGKYGLDRLDLGKFMRMDAAAQRALSVMRGRGDASDTFSLFGLLNRGKTAMGKRLLRTWLKQPLLDLDTLRMRHDVVEALVGDAELRQALQQMHLRGLPDLEMLSRKLERGKASLSDLCQLYRASSRLPLIEAVLRAHSGPHASTLMERFADPLALAHDADHLVRFEALLETAIDLDRIPDEYLIAASYDPGLQEVEVEKLNLEKKIQGLAEEAAQDLGLCLDKTIKLEWHKFANQRLRCLRITTKEEKSVRSKLRARYLELETRKDGLKFTNKALKAAAERLQALASEYDSRQSTLVAQVVSVAATFCQVWEQVRSVLAELDVLVAFADVAVTAPRPYVRPSMLPADGGRVELVGCRHPCVELQEGVDFIPNDCVMQRGESWFQIITGPNMGGKSTFIRQVGISVLLAQVGSWVPCTQASIAVRDAIFARVGAGDSQARGVSTFMAEMLESAAILKGATPASLVIIDELGRGTSTWDGMGLAWAISEHLMNGIGCPTLFATHFHELTALRGAGGVKNLHVGAAIDHTSGALTMLYQVEEGSCDKSFGIHVAEFARFPPAIVEAARKAAAAAASDKHQADSEVSASKRQKAGSDAALQAALLEFAELPLEGGAESGRAREALTSWQGRAAALLKELEV
ncbi:hypothetical protein ACKKBG_A33190 [Auxenochlorella protothecoides x Auxenochlorella symbiontica]